MAKIVCRPERKKKDADKKVTVKGHTRSKPKPIKKGWQPLPDFTIINRGGCRLQLCLVAGRVALFDIIPIHHFC